MDAAVLRAVDTITQRILGLAAPVRLEVARRPAQVEAIQRLRFVVARELGWIEADAASDGLERDRYDDDHAIHIGAWDDERLVGTQRIIFPARARRLPVEEVFALELEPHGQVVQVDRTAIARSHRGDRRHLLLAALMSRSWLAWRSRGFYRCVGIVTEPMLQVYRDVGLGVEILGEAREYYGELRVPARFEVLGALRRLTELWVDSPARGRPDIVTSAGPRI